jgi:isoleucyl-tRNA synthetase
LILDINNFEVCKINDNDWTEILEVKKAVSKSLEEKRVDNIIGSSLEADVTIYCSDELYNILSELGKS